MGTIFRGSADAETARRAHERRLADGRPEPGPPVRLAAAELRQLCLDQGADDVGFVEVGRPALEAQREAAERLLPGARTLISLMVTLHRDNIAAPPRSVANHSFHHGGDRLDQVAHAIARALQDRGVRAVTCTVGFPMEVGQIGTGQIWEIAHKPVAVEAGLGHMGINRNVIHPRFGNFVLLDTLVVEAELDLYDRPLDYNPCADCNLCVAACPVGAISRTDEFDFFACLNHNYREFLFGFADWATTLAAAGSAEEYRTKFREDETVSLWQSLGFGPQYKSAYCMAVCPAGDDVIGPYLQDRRGFVATYLRPLRDRPEPVYVQSGTRAERVAARNPAKEVRYIDYQVGVASVESAIRGLQHMFDGRRGDCEGLAVRCVIETADPDVYPDVYPDVGPEAGSSEGGGEADGGGGLHELVLGVRRGALVRLEGGTGAADGAAAGRAEPTATVRGPLATWMRLLTQAAAGHPAIPDGMTVTGDVAAVEALVGSLR